MRKDVRGFTPCLCFTPRSQKAVTRLLRDHHLQQWLYKTLLYIWCITLSQRLNYHSCRIVAFGQVNKYKFTVSKGFDARIEEAFSQLARWQLVHQLTPKVCYPEALCHVWVTKTGSLIGSVRTGQQLCLLPTSLYLVIVVVPNWWARNKVANRGVLQALWMSEILTFKLSPDDENRSWRTSRQIAVSKKKNQKKKSLRLTNTAVLLQKKRHQAVTTDSRIVVFHRSSFTIFNSQYAIIYYSLTWTIGSSPLYHPWGASRFR